jgi:CRISPR-associated protein Cas1
MAARIIDVGDKPCRLRVRLGCLVVQRESAEVMSVPAAEIACLIVPPHTELTSAVVAELTAAGAATLFVDARWQPASMALPVSGHSAQTQRTGWQVDRIATVRDALWAQIVKAKLQSQSRTLGGHAQIDKLATAVEPGDPSNLEAQAARLYWPALMGAGFLRDRDADDENRALNYGYAVLRACVARAVCAAGLHPSIGLHHASKYDAFALASDLMEPYRVLVDRAARGMREVTRDSKRALLSAILDKSQTIDGALSLFEMASRTTLSLVEIFRDGGELWLAHV